MKAELSLLIPPLLKITDANLWNVESQFLFMISDTDVSDTDVAMDLERAKDGHNIAFIYNTSKKKGANSCAVIKHMSLP